MVPKVFEPLKFDCTLSSACVQAGVDVDDKFSVVLYTKRLPFFAEKCEELLQCKSSSHFLGKNINRLNGMYTRRLMNH